MAHSKQGQAPSRAPQEPAAQRVAIRPLNRKDLDVCAQLFVRVFNAAPWHDHWSEGTALARLRDVCDTPGFCGVIALEGDVPRGFALGYAEQWCVRKDFYLKEMCVDPACQRQGIGTAMMAALEASLAESGIATIYLLTVRLSTAERFYRRRGFEIGQRMVMMVKKAKRKTRRRRT